MNIVELGNRFTQEPTQIKIGRISSETSVSTIHSQRSCSHQDNSCQKSAYTYETAHFQSQFVENSQMIQQQQISFPVDISTYLNKRKAVMSWLKKYGQQLSISKTCLASALYYADLYYHNSEYIKQSAKMVLASLLILASKQSDYKILYTSTMAYICQLDQNKLIKTETQSCQKLDFNMCIDNYTILLDRLIYGLKENTNFDLYTQDEQTFIKLSMVHQIAERLYVECYQWDVCLQDLWYIVKLVCADLMDKQGNSILIQYINKQSIKYYQQQQKQNKQNKLQIRQLINNYIMEWKRDKQSKARLRFQNRKNMPKYTTYEQFSILYYE